MRYDNRRELTPRELARQRRREQIQRRRLVAALCVLGLIIIIIVLVATCGDSNEGATTTTTTAGESTSTTLGAATYTAKLTGEESVPPVETDATGDFLLSYDPNDGTLTYTLEVNGLNSPSVAAIYEGAPGDAGTAVYTLFAGPAEEGDFSGVLGQGTIDERDLTGSLEGATLGDLIALIKDGQAYVSVGTTKNPVDAIRGQIAETTETSTSDTTGTTEGTTAD